MIEHAQKVASDLGFKTLYLESNHIGFYEKFGYEVIGKTSDPFGERAKIYAKNF